LAVFVEDSPLSDKPQQIKLGIELEGIGVARIICRWAESTSGISLEASYSLLLVMKSNTLKDVLMGE